MNTLAIILAIYVGLDIICGVGLYGLLRIKGWSPCELGRKFRSLLTESADDFLEDIADEVNDIRGY